MKNNSKDLNVVVSTRLVLICILLLLGQSLAYGQSCTNLTDNQLREAGYEPVRAFGAVGDGAGNNPTDNTQSIQRAIDTALANRRMVYFHPGDYLITDTLVVRQETRNTNGNSDLDRFGVTLLGSYCGTEKPTIRFPDFTCDTPNADTPACHALETNESTIAENPKPVILLMRENGSNTEGIEPSRTIDIADSSASSRDWNQVVRNLRIVTGNNSGVVGIRHLGAEGSSAQEVTIDATGAFAGFYQVNSSGGYTYRAEVIGGRYGLYIPFARGGATVVVGLKLRGQSETPIIANHYGPLTLVAADIEHNDGKIIGGTQGGLIRGSGVIRAGEVIDRLGGSQVSGGHLSLIDSRVEITSNTNNPVFDNRQFGSNPIEGNRSVYIKNTYFNTSTNNTTVLDNNSTGDLSVPRGGRWYRVSEYSSSGDFDTAPGVDGGETNLIRGVTTEDTFYDDPQCGANQRCTRTTNLSINNPVSSVPTDLAEQHFYEEGLCNVEAQGTVFISPIDAGQSLHSSIVNGTGAIAENENSTTDGDGNDFNAIQEAINLAAENGRKQVFIPGGKAITDASGGTNVRRYHVRGTLNLSDGVHLCGASRSTSILSAGRRGNINPGSNFIPDNHDSDRWVPTSDSPVIRTENIAGSTVAIADIAIHVPVPAQLLGSRNPIPGTNLTAPNYEPYVFHLDWRAGRDSVVKDVWWKYDFGDSGERISVQINNNGGGRWYGITQQNGFKPSFRNESSDEAPDSAGLASGESNESFRNVNNNNQIVLSPKSKHILISGTKEPLAFYPFHCQHITLPFGSQCDIVDAQNVSLYGVKQEAASTPEIIAAVLYFNRPDVEITPIWMRISDSHNINLYGYESHSEYAEGRGAIEISGNNSGITIANMATRNFPQALIAPQDWYFVKENVNGVDHFVSSESGVMPLFKSVDTPPVEVPDEQGGICFPVKVVNGGITLVCL